MAMSPEERRRRHAESERRRRAEGKVDDTEWRKAWRAAHPEKVREMNRRAGRKYAAANSDKERERRKRFRAEHPTYWADRREQGRQYEAAWRERNPTVRSWRSRRLAMAGILLVVKVDADHCGVCLGPLTTVPYPDPMATTVGHEPPLSVAKRDGWTIVAERPEHLRCNLRKGDRMDVDLRHAATA